MNAPLPTAVPAHPLTVSLAMTPDLMALIQRGATYLSVAQAYEITDPDTAQLAAHELTTVKKMRELIVKGKADFVLPAKQIIANAEKWFDPGIEGCDQSETLLKSRLLEWDKKEQQRVAIENAQREDAARKARQEAEARAAAERAKADEIAAQKRREAEDAERRREAAEAEGNKRAAQAAAADKARLEEQARSALENGHARATEAHLQAAAVASAAAPQSPAKIAGFQTRKNWVCRLKTGVTETQAKALIAAESAKRPSLLAFLKLDTGSLNKAAKTYEDALDVPGYEAYNDPIGAGSRK